MSSSNNQIFCELDLGHIVTPAMKTLAEAFNGFVKSDEEEFFKHAAWEYSVVVIEHLVFIEKEKMLIGDEITNFFNFDNMFRILNESNHRLALQMASRNNRDYFVPVFGKFFKYLETVMLVPR